MFKFDSATNGYIANFTLEAKSDMTYDGKGSAVDTPEDWYCTAAEHTLKMATSRAAGYLNDGTTPAGYFQKAALSKQRTNIASACQAADNPSSYYDQTFTSVTTFGSGCAHENESAEVTKAATCSATGEMTYTCTNCGATRTEVIPIDENAHQWNEGEVTTAATCSATGVMTYTCVYNAAHTKTEEIAIDENAHDWDDGAVTTPATCVAAGVKTFTCKNDASHTRTESVAIDPTAHTWDEGTVTRAATCTEEGILTYTCIHDATHNRTEAIPVLEHDYVVTVVKATCTEGGYTLYKCSRCNDEFRTDETSPLNHDWGEGVVTKAPTCCAEGEMTFTCKNDATHTKTEAIAVDENAHDWGEGVVTTAATCTAAGVKTFTCKNDASHTKTEAVPVNADAHDWDDGVVTTAATCSAAGVKTFTCKNDATHTRTESVAIDPNAHDYDAKVTAPTCTEQGFTTYTCKHNASHTYTADYTEALGHDWGEGAVTKKATEYEEGVRTYTCAHCGETKTETIAKLPMSELMLTASINPTVTAHEITVKAPYSRKGKMAFKLTASTLYEDDVDVTYTCSNPKLLRVDDDGNVTFQRLRLCCKNRKATITARYADGREATCQVTVKLKWWQYIIFFLFGCIWF